MQPIFCRFQRKHLTPQQILRKKDHLGGLRGTILSAQYFSAFLTAVSQYFASVLRAHSFTEAVYLFAFAYIRFESRSHELMHPLTGISLTHILRSKRQSTHFHGRIDRDLLNRRLWTYLLQTDRYLQADNVLIFTENAFIHLITFRPKSQTKLDFDPLISFPQVVIIASFELSTWG